MSEERNSSIDDILEDVQRMLHEREEEEASDRMRPTSAGYSMQDIDMFLGLYDPLSDYSEYAESSEADEPDAPEHVTLYSAPERGAQPDRTPAEAPAGDVEAGHTKVMPAVTGRSAETDADRAAEVKPFSRFRKPGKKQPSAPTEPDAADTVDEHTKVISAVTEQPQETKTPPDGKTRPFSPARLLHKKPKPEKPALQPEVDGQIMLSGFETEEPVQELDEQAAEEELHSRRAEQVKDFRLYALAQQYDPDLPPKTDLFEPEPEPAAEESQAEPEEREYRRFSERMEIGRHLQENRSTAFLTLCGLLILEIALIVLSAVTGRLAGSERSVLYAVQLILITAAAALSISTMAKGARELIHLTPSCSTAALITTAVTLIHSVVALLLPDSPGIPGMFGAAAVLTLLLSRAANLFESIGILSNFKFCAFSAAEHLHEICAFSEKRDTFEIAQNLEADEPKLRYASKTNFPADFLKNSDFRSTVDRLCKIIIPSALGAALLAALFGWIRTKAGLSALTAFTGAICIAMPAGAAFTVSVPVVLLMLQLNRRGGMIVSPSAAGANTGLTAVAMDVADLYDEEKCSIDCYQEFYTIRFDDMFLYAAALVIGVHGPLESAFMEIVRNTDILPPVKNLVCEERLGISGIIRGQSVLLGNRNLLTAHSLEAPPKSVEITYLQDGRRVLYLAIGDKVTTMFVVNYTENDALIAPMQILHDNETGFIVNVTDCNLTDEYLCEGFDLPQGSIKAMSPKAGEILRARCAEETESASAKLMTNGKAEALLYTLADAAVIHNIQRVAAFVCVIACVIGWLVTFVLMLIKGVDVVNWVLATLYTLLWTAVSAALGILQMRKIK